MKHFTRTKVVATIGPASDSVSKLEQMMLAGMRVARLNFSHGDHPSHAKLIKSIRAAARRLGIEVAILQDLQGPRIRVGNLPEQGVAAKKGSKLALVGESQTRIGVPGHLTVPIQYQELYRDVRKGTTILIEDGTIQLKVLKVKNKVIYCKTKVAGVIKSHKGINVPDVTLSVDVITDKDKKDIVFGQKHGVDYVALSFVKDASDIRRLKQLIKKAQPKGTLVPTKAMAKIERKEALANLDDIVEEVDAIMVARGDMGIEVSPQEVPIWQKTLIEKCLEHAKPVIVATQMLDSMIHNPQPTRAEVSDVANAVIDHTDAVMLSGESATGKYPIKAVKMLTKVAIVTEGSRFDDFVCGPQRVSGKDAALAHAACQMHLNIGAKAAIVFTKDGESARLLSRHRPELPIIALTPDLRVQRQLALSWGVIAVKVSEKATGKLLLKRALDFLQKQKLARKGDMVIIVHPESFSPLEAGHQLRLHRMGDPA